MWMFWRSDKVIRSGDYVRDRAGLGGRVLQFWWGWAAVEWNNGQTGFIKPKWLTKQPVQMT